MPGSTWMRWAGAALVLGAAFTGPARAQTPPAPAPSTAPSPAQDAAAGPEKIALANDSLARMTIPVMIDGQGPFPFVIDTGADRTVISDTLAATLKLPDGPPVILHNSGGVDEVQTVVIRRLGVGKRIIDRVEAPVLSAANLGAAGLLGIDSLKDQHVVMDFTTQQFLTQPSHAEPFEPGEIVVRGRSRFGQLILVDATVRGVKVYVIVDSGAQNTVGNLALRNLLSLEHDGPVQLSQVISVTGRNTPAEFHEVNEIQVGDLAIRNVPLAFADLHTFARFGLADHPAMLLGMDVLGVCKKVTVDFKRREATFTLKQD